MPLNNRKSWRRIEKAKDGGFLADVSIRRKLIYIFMVISVLVVLLTSAPVIFYQLMSSRRNMVNNLSVVAEMIAENCVASLAFDDAGDAKIILSSLKAKPSIVFAAVRRPDGTLFAQYRKAGFSSQPLPAPAAPYAFVDSWLLVRRPVMISNKKVGSICIQSDLEEISIFLRQSMMVSGVIAVVVLLVAFIISYRLQKIISKPVLMLADVAETISRDRDYAIRARMSRGDEFGVLTTAFNNMLSQIESQDLAMRRMRNLLRNIIDSMPSVIIGVDGNGCVTQWNREAERLTGVTLDAAGGKPVTDVFPELKVEMDRVKTAITEKRGQKAEKMIRRMSGGNRYMDMTVYPLVADGGEGAVIRIDDVTEKTRIQEMMVQTEKMMSVGGLAAGMAHEINNPLSGILQCVQTISKRFSPDVAKNVQEAEELGIDFETMRQYMQIRKIFYFLESIQDAGLRASRIVKNMLQFSRKNDYRLVRENVPELIDRAVALASSDFDLKRQYDFKRIRIEKEYEPDMPMIPCIATEIEQVVFNLLKNAAQAMREQGDHSFENRIGIRTYRKDGMACIEVSDNGPGMPEAICKRIFEPFFTTKKVGVGTGLGLSVAYFIVTNNHKGKMYVESAPGEGSCFTILLPQGA